MLQKMSEYMPYRAKPNRSQRMTTHLRQYSGWSHFNLNSVWSRLSSCLITLSGFLTRSGMGIRVYMRGCRMVVREWIVFQHSLSSLGIFLSITNLRYTYSHRLNRTPLWSQIGRSAATLFEPQGADLIWNNMRCRRVINHYRSVVDHLTKDCILIL